MANIDEIAMLAVIEVVEEAEIAAAEPARQFYRRIRAFDLSNKKFIRMFRLTKELVHQVVDVLSVHIPEATRRSAVDVETKLLITLRFFATGSYQLDCGSNIHLAVSQPSVSRAIHDVVNALNHPQVFNRFVKFPENAEELHMKRQEFYKEFGFPGVIGCIDCTHVAIIAPNQNDSDYPENIYVNRKNYHSINVQLVCDNKLRILNVNARYPGSTNDAFIWNNSNVKVLMENISRNGQGAFYLLGDSGYPLRPWLLTPLEHEPEDNTPEAEYNKCHKRTRYTIERCNGLLKSRFRCLLKHRVLNYHPEMASKIIIARIVLHNMCVDNNVPEPEIEDEDDEFDFGMLVNEPCYNEANSNPRTAPDLLAARRLQRRLIQNHFINIVKHQ